MLLVTTGVKTTATLVAVLGARVALVRLRVNPSGGAMVMLTAEWRLMRELERTRKFTPSKIIRVSVLGKPAAIYLCRKG